MRRIQLSPLSAALLFLLSGCSAPAAPQDADASTVDTSMLEASMMDAPAVETSTDSSPEDILDVTADTPDVVQRQPTCTDSQQNGTETDTDCGGDRCPSCTTGLRCLLPRDCRSGMCLATGRCQ